MPEFGVFQYNLDDGGRIIYPDRYAHTLTYSGTGKVATIAFTDGTNTWTQTLTYDGSDNLTGISQWVRS